MLSPYKGAKHLVLTHEQYQWNFLQSSTRMPVERAFGILKARWRILLKRNDMKLLNTMRVVATCLVLHNMCIVHKDSFDESWLRDAHIQLTDILIRHRQQQGGPQYCATEDALQEVGLALNPQARVDVPNDACTEPNNTPDRYTLHEKGCRRRLAIQQTLVHSKRTFADLNEVEDISSSSSDSELEEIQPLSILVPLDLLTIMSTLVH